ncbi:hypothetical protein J4427_03430, partial [Candidatus Woesearchaeota archaeon]|nr:hypothetical protein [Candidatus Woesearchaeota archaeon]
MPTITINKKIFENLVGKKLENEKLKDRLSLMGVSVDDLNS